MKYLSITALLLASLVLATGCATPQPPQAIQTTERFSATKDQVWHLVLSEIGLNYPVSSIEKDSGLITTDFVSLPAGMYNSEMGRWVQKPNAGMFATFNGLRMKMNILVSETTPATTTVTVRAHFEAYENNVHKQWIACPSNGTIEIELFTLIRASLPQATARK